MKDIFEDMERGYKKMLEKAEEIVEKNMKRVKREKSSKVIKVGNSKGIIIPSYMAKILNIEDGEIIQIELDIENREIKIRV